MEVYRLCGIAVITALLAAALRSVKPELGAQAAVSGGVLLLIITVSELSGAAEAVRTFMKQAGLGADPAQLAFKTVGIAYISQTAADICRDMGENSIASKAELCGRLMIVSAALPMLKELMEKTAALIGEYL